jgi:hypothetical protein
MLEAILVASLLLSLSMHDQPDSVAAEQASDTY